MSYGNRKVLEMADQLTSYEPAMQSTSNGNHTVDGDIMEFLGFAPGGVSMTKVCTPIGEKYSVEGISPLNYLKHYVR